ncbi:MAG: hypothetical protein NTU80_10640 [Verrucomicrobia bacterium]|nr:hypothetical protein [Verrucomicrobiota bacterium]
MPFFPEVLPPIAVPVRNPALPRSGPTTTDRLPRRTTAPPSAMFTNPRPVRP